MGEFKTVMQIRDAVEVCITVEKYTNYSVQVLGFTEEDKIGPQSTPVYAMTDQDGKVFILVLEFSRRGG